jgi:hypothetical protein
VVIRGIDQAVFREACSRSALLERLGDRRVLLSTANTYSYRKMYAPFRDYVGEWGALLEGEWVLVHGVWSKTW